MHRFVPCYSTKYGGKDRLCTIEFEENQSPIIRQDLAQEISRCTLQELLLANSSNNIRRTLSTNDTTTSPSSDWTDHEAQIRRIQYFWRKHFPKVMKTRKLNETRRGSIFVSYLALVATCVPKESPLVSTLAVRAQLLTEGIELQMTLDSATQKLQTVRKVFQDLFDDTSLPPSTLEALQESWTVFLLHESTVARIRTNWSTDQLRSENWWFDPAKLKATMTNNLEQLGSIQEGVDALKLV